MRLIFRLYLDGESLLGIAQRLTNLGLKNALGTTIANILRNEKYAGDALLQKTYTVDCLTHKKVVNKGEKPRYLVKNCHAAIIDRDMFNLTQQEYARRSSKRKKSEKVVTEQGKYSRKYVLTELMICGECGTPYRRCTWNVHGKKQIVWRCISRLDHGSRYCHNSPTMHEDKLQTSLIRTISDFFECDVDMTTAKRKSAMAWGRPLRIRAI